MSAKSAKKTKAIEPSVPLYPYQARWVEDTARFKLAVKGVQTGFSFAESLSATLDSLKFPGRLRILLSASDRQSVELMDKVGMHTRGMGVMIESGFFEQTSISQHTALFPNRSRIICLPANPDTARGYAGDVSLDEFAMHRDPRAIWAAMIGRATRGYNVRVMSSFKGTANKFHELAKECGLHEGLEPAENPLQKGIWSAHWVSLSMAVRQGLKDVDLAEIREAYGDDEIYAQECECVPMSGGDELIPLEMVIACESADATLDFDYRPRPELYAGVDIGRKRDLTVIWIMERVGDVLVTRGVITLVRQPFHVQQAALDQVLECVDRLAIDARGLGAQLAEESQRRFPGKVEAVEATMSIKEQMVLEAKRMLEERRVRLPESRAIRRAFTSVKKYVSVTGQLRFDAPRTEQGHADEFFAFVNAVGAASTSRNYVPASECGLVGQTVAGRILERVF